MGREQRLVADRRAAWVSVAGEAAPGAWLRLAALGGAGVTTLVVISGALQLGVPHRALGILAAPPVAAVVVAAAGVHRRLLAISAAALGLLLGGNCQAVQMASLSPSRRRPYRSLNL